MAETRLNPMLEFVRGSVGELVFKRYGSRVVLSRKPVFSNRKFSRAQMENQSRFREAALYAKEAMADNDRRRVYEAEARLRDKPILSLMIGDFLRPPAIGQVDVSEYAGQSGGRIIVHATDDFEVTKVEVTISSDAGDVIEQGRAVSSGNGTWVYVASESIQPREAVHIDVKAFDRPNHTASMRRTV